MTREEMLSELEKLRPWFHCIDLGAGLRTKTESVMGEPVEHPRGPWQIIERCLPADLSGKTLLDVGCNAGFYAVEAKRRGAARVFGIDAQRQHIRQALFVRRVLGLDIQYRRMSVYDLSPRSVGRFDITLALGLIYHCKHLVLALEKLFQVTKELLIIETAIFPQQQAPKSFVHTLGEFTQTLHPLAYVENPPEAKEQVFNWFLPSIECLQALLKNIGFHEVTVFATTNEGERAVLVCRKQESSVDGRVLSHFVAIITLEEGPAVCRPASELLFRIRVENSGLARWTSTGDLASERGMVQLGSHLLREDEEELRWDYGRAALKSDLEPGEADHLDIRLQAPATPGKYVVEFDMVAEHLAWFEDFGSGTLRHELRVE